MRKTRGQKFTKLRPDHGGSDKLAGFIFADCKRCHQAYPAPNLPFTQKCERVADGVHFILNAKCGGVQIAQQTVADGDFLLDRCLRIRDDRVPAVIRRAADASN